MNVKSVKRCQSTNQCDDTVATPMMYDSLGRQTTGLTAGWDLTTKQYDAVDRVTAASDAMGNLRALAYGANGNLTSQTLTQIVTARASYAMRARPPTTSRTAEPKRSTRRATPRSSITIPPETSFGSPTHRPFRILSQQGFVAFKE